MSNIKAQLNHACDELELIRIQLLNHYGDTKLYRELLRLSLKLEEMAQPVPRCEQKVLWFVKRNHNWTYCLDVCGTRPLRRCTECKQEEAWLMADKRWAKIDNEVVT